LETYKNENSLLKEKLAKYAKVIKGVYRKDIMDNSPDF